MSTDPTYYPSVKARLIVRFDEFARTDSVSGKAPQKITTKLKGIKDPRSAAKAILDETAPAGVRRYYLSPETKRSTVESTSNDSSSDGLTHPIGGIIPSHCEVSLNGIRTADTASLEFKYLDLPIDPRIVRSCAVEIYMGTVTSQDFRDGQLGKTRVSASTGGSEPLSVVPDTYTDSNGRPRTNLRFQGWVDEWEVEYSDNREPIVKMRCRDNTQTLIDTDAPPGLVLSMDSPVDEAIAIYLSNFPSFAGLTVEYRPGGVTVPTFRGQLGKTAYNAKTGGPAPSKGGGTSKLSVWDYLTDICGAIGHQIRLEGTAIIIQQVRTITGKENLARGDDPFQGRTVDGLDVRSRMFIYGRNLSSLKFGRKFGKTAPKNIEVRSYSSRLKTTLVERFPLEKSPLVTTAQPGDGRSEVEYKVITVSGIENRSTLKLIAQSTFEMLGRNEISVTMKTNDLASFGGDNLDPDIMDMRAGDTVDVQVNRLEDGFATVNVVDNIFASVSRAREFLRTVGYSAEFADAAAKATSDAGFQTRFRVKAVTFNWDIDSGISISINAANYIEVKIDQQWQGAIPESGTTATVKRSQGK